MNATAAALLGLLQDGPATGGELVARARSRHAGYFALTRSQVYRELPILTGAGLLRLGRTGLRASQQYVLTAAGRRAFRAWLGAGAGWDSVRSPLLLRLAHLEALSVAEQAALVADARAQLTTQLAAARAAARAADGIGASAAAEFAVAHLRAVGRALDKVAPG